MEEKIPHRIRCSPDAFLFNALQNHLRFHSSPYELFKWIYIKIGFIVVVFLAQKEYRILIKNALETNSSEAEGFFIHAMNNSFVFIYECILFFVKEKKKTSYKLMW